MIVALERTYQISYIYNPLRVKYTRMNLLEYATGIAKEADEGKLKVSPEIKVLQEDTDKGQCPICHKQIEEYTSKKGKTYIANIDHSPHRAGPLRGDKKCVFTWDEFNADKGGSSSSAATTHAFVNISQTDGLRDELKEFDTLVSNAYIKLYDIAGRGNPGAAHRDLHITTMGLMHDYFTWLASGKPNAAK